MKERRNHLPRDLKALRYLDALNAGDLDAVSNLWEEASHDPELERMLVEIDGAVFQEIPGNPRSLPARFGPRRWATWGVAVGTLAAACLLAILASTGPDATKPGSKPPINQTGIEAARPSSDVSHDFTPLLSVRRDLDEAALPGFVWPLETALSASTRLDLLD